MKLLVVSQYFYPEIFRINDLVDELVSRGHSVTVLTGLPNYPGGKIYSNFKENPSAFQDYKGAKVIRVPILPRGKGNGLQLFFNYLSFAVCASTYGVFKLWNQKFDAIFVNQLSPVTVGLPAIILRYIKHAPIIFWVQDLWPDTLQALRVINSKILLGLVGGVVRFTYNYSDLILVQSRGFISGVQKYASEAKRIIFFPNWAEQALNISCVSAAPEIPIGQEECFNVLFTGNIGDAQDFPAVIAAASLLKMFPSIRWYVVGDGSMRKGVERQIVEKSLEKTVFLLGQFPLERMPSFYKSANVLLVSLQDRPIFSMTIPSKVQAYLASGVPIAGMINGEGSRIILDSKAGFTCAAGDSKGLADLILQLSKAPKDQLLNMGLNGLNYSKRYFNRKDLISSLENYLSNITYGDK